jgi:hypothetical protein
MLSHGFFRQSQGNIQFNDAESQAFLAGDF